MASASWSPQRHLACSLYSCHLLKKSLQLSLGSYKVSTSCPSCPLPRNRCHPDTWHAILMLNFKAISQMQGWGCGRRKGKGLQRCREGGKRLTMAQNLSCHGDCAVAPAAWWPWGFLGIRGQAEQQERGAPDREGDFYGAAGLTAQRGKACGFSKSKAPFDLR